MSPWGAAAPPVSNKREELMMEKVMQGWFETYWPKFKKAVNKSVRRSQDARDRAARIERRLARSFAAKVYLFRQQKGICPYCGQAITWGKGLEHPPHLSEVARRLG